MKKYFLLLFTISTLAISSCSSRQFQTTSTDLSPAEFAGKIEELPEAPVIDVRTPGEFSEDHLPNAINFNWNGSEFENQIATLDKSKPVLVYCRSGSRSAAAAKKMRSEGFEVVYELNGGIMKWKDSDLPVTKDN